MRTSAIPRRVRQLCAAAKEVALETLWPTRCAGCDTPGERVLCARCERALAYIDACHACPTCGAPFGRIQCTQCNEVVLASLGLDALPVDGMTHAVMLDDTARRIVTLYKDADERRLAHDIARLLVRYVSPDRVREGCIISYIPDSASALRRRGFDHARELAEACAMRTSMPCASLFARPDSLDQRTLGKRGRIANMSEQLHVAEGVRVPRSVLLVDDVCTTGATMFSAALALRQAGCAQVWALTFARAMGES